MNVGLPAGRCLIWLCRHPAAGRGMCSGHAAMYPPEALPAPGKRNPPCTQCEGGTIHARGLCRACYQRETYRLAPDRQAVLAAKRKRQRGYRDRRREERLARLAAGEAA